MCSGSWTTSRKILRTRNPKQRVARPERVRARSLATSASEFQTSDACWDSIHLWGRRVARRGCRALGEHGVQGMRHAFLFVMQFAWQLVLHESRMGFGKSSPCTLRSCAFCSRRLSRAFLARPPVDAVRYPSQILLLIKQVCFAFFLVDARLGIHLL